MSEKRKSPTYIEPGICSVCGTEFVQLGASQKYCNDCCSVAKKDNQDKWVVANPDRRKEHANKYANDIQQDMRQLANDVNSENASNIAWDASAKVLPIWTIRVAIPYTPALSKNRLMFRSGTSNRMVWYEDSRAARAELTIKVRNAFALSAVKPVQAKVWLDILVQKPHGRFDAVNVVDLVCDAVKDAIGVDDKWYSIRRLDWEVVKVNPRIMVGISQTTDTDQQICSGCGIVLELTNFPSNAAKKNGKGSVCHSCLEAAKNLKKQKREINR